MKCPHCFINIDIQIEYCPGCNCAVEWQATPPPAGAKETPSPGAVPVPGDPDDVTVVDIDAAPDTADGGMEGAMSGLGQNVGETGPAAITADADGQADVPSAAAHGRKASNSNIQIGVALAVVIGLYMSGILNGILITVGLKDRPAPVIAVTDTSSAMQPDEPEEEEGAEAADDSPAAPDDAENQLDAAPAAEPVAAAPEPVEKPEEKPEPVKAPEEWWFYGKVYDLLTLQSLADVELVFIGGESDFNFRTDAKGEFKVKLPILYGGGYEIVIDRRGYDERYLVDKSPSYRKLSKANRSKLWGKIPTHKPLTGKKAQWQRKDLVLFPSVTGR